MALDPTLWQSFYRTQDALLLALRSSIARMTSKDVLSERRAERDRALHGLRDHQKRIADLSKNIMSMQEELEEMKRALVKGIGRVQGSLSPIGMLPPELLRDIILYAAQPRDHRMIMSMSSVCDLWRAAVISERSLFSEANWDDWPIDVLVAWCSRARGSPLTIRLGTKACHRLFPENTRRQSDTLIQLLESTRSSWQALHVHMRFFMDFRECSEVLFGGVLHSLHTLCYDVPRHSGLRQNQIEVVAPNLRTLGWHTRVRISLISPINYLTDLYFTPVYWAQWGNWMDIFQKATSLTRMDINLTMFNDLIPEDSEAILNAHIPCLLTLRIHLSDSREILHASDHMHFPRLREVIIVSNMMEDSFHTVLAALVRHPLPEFD